MPRSATSAEFPSSRQLVAYLGLDPRVSQLGSSPAAAGGSLSGGSPQPRWALVEATVNVVRQPGPLHAFHDRVGSRRGAGIATVDVARKLACLFWCLLTRGENYAHAQPSLTAKKLRKLELRAGAPLAQQAEAPYVRMVRNWQATAPKKVARARHRSGA